MDHDRFDALTRAFATSPSRRRLLHGAAAAVAAGLMARWQVSAAASCGAFCNDLPPGRARGDCARACAREPGLMAECGGDPTRLCLAGDGTATCCAGGVPCTGGACALACTFPEGCPEDCVCSGAVGPTAETQLCYHYTVHGPCESRADCPSDQACFGDGSSGSANCVEFDYETGCPEHPCPAGRICIGTLGGPACVPACSAAA